MAVVNKAIVKAGEVVNIIVIDDLKPLPNHFLGEDEILVDVDENCQIGGTYFKATQQFTKAPSPEPSRLDILMGWAYMTLKVDMENGTIDTDFHVPRSEEEMNADKVELAALLKERHKTASLTHEQLDMRVRLNLDGF